MKLLNLINQRSTGKSIILLFCTSAVLGTLIITMFFNHINLNPDATMDSLNFYTSETFFRNLDIQGDEGRVGYLQLHLIDYFFITQFYLLFVMIINNLLRKLNSSGKILILSLLPFVAAAFDLLENIFIDISILIYPKKFMLMGDICGFFTLIKMAVIYILFVVILILSIIYFVRKIPKKR